MNWNQIHKRLGQEALQRPLLLLLTAILGIGSSLCGIGWAWILSLIINRAFLQQETVKGLGDPLAILLAGLMGLAALRALLSWSSDSAASGLSVKVKSSLRTQLIERLIDSGPAALRQERTGELTNTLTNGVEALEAYFNQFLPQVILAVVIPPLILIMVSRIDLISALVLLLTGPLIPIFMFLIGSSAQQLTQRQWHTLSRMSAYFLDVIQGLTTLKILGCSKRQAETIAQVSNRYRQTTMSVLRMTFISALALELLSTLSTALVAVQIGLRLLYGQIDFLPAFFILVLAPEYYLPLRQLGLRFHAATSGAAAGRRIFALLDPAAQGLQPLEPDTGLEHKTGEVLMEDILLEQVSYQYEAGRSSLNGVSFKIPAGQTTALIGPSGAGKSTLANLILGFIQPSTGIIHSGSRSLAEIPKAAWWQQIAWVPQNPYLFNDTILANLRLGNPEASREAMREAAQLAGADGFIQSLPQGYDTPVGERGQRLSGGEAQRLALARAFLKKAPLVILDEPTTYLDPASEALVAEGARRLAAGRTMLVIAHRLQTVRRANQVAVLENGRLVQCGTPSKIAQEQGSFLQLRSCDEMNALMDETKDYWNPKDLEVKLATKASTPAVPVHETARPRPSSFQAALYLVKLLRPYALPMAISILLSFGAVASSAGLMGSAAYVIASAALRPSIADLQVAIVGVRFFGLARGVMRYLERLASHQVTFLLLARLRTTVYKALESLAPSKLMYHQSGDLLNRIVSDIAVLEDFYVRGAAPLLTALITALAAGLFFGFFSTAMALAIWMVMLAAGLGLPALGIWMGRQSGPRLVEANARLSAALIDTLQGLGELLIFGQIQKQKARLQEAKDTLDRLQRKMGIQNAGLSSLGGLLAALGLWSVLILAIELCGQGRLKGVLIGALALMALASFEAVQTLPQATRQLSAQFTAAGRLLEIIQEPPAASKQVTALPLPADLTLEAHNLIFKYPTGGIGIPRGLPLTSQQNALQGLSFRLEPGQILAITGPSGAGKSTMVHLLLRLWEPDSGSLTLGGVDLRRLETERLRQGLAVLPQQIYLFNASLGDNLRLANPDASEAQLMEACREAQLETLIEELPEGLDTWIGESGVRLSAGERQRVALARALVKDSPVLILDEPTANLDTQTGQAIWEMLHSRKQKQAILIITHQLEGLEAADEIIVLAEGHPVERGTYKELMRRRGFFWQLRQIERNMLYDTV